MVKRLVLAILYRVGLKKLIAFGVIGLVLIVVLIGAVVYKNQRNKTLTETSQPTAETAQAQESAGEDLKLAEELGYVPTEVKVKAGGMPEKVFSVLLLGHGDMGHVGGSLTDGIMILRIDTQNKKVALVSIPRDTWVELPIDGNQTRGYKVNAAYSIGGSDKKYPRKPTEFKGENGPSNIAKYAVEKITGIPIDYFVAIDFYDLVNAVDTVGGVDVTLENGFEDKYYPVRGRELETCGKSPEEVTQLSDNYSGFELEKQFECRYEVLKFDTGKNHLDGEGALKFMRSRHSPTEGSDYSRARRQQLVVMGIKEQLLKLDSLDKAIPFFEKVAKSIRTDVDSKIIKAMIELMVGYPQYSNTRVVLAPENVLAISKSDAGAFILIPKAGENNWQEIQAYVKSEIDK